MCLLPVKLIQEPSRGDVLSDLWAGAADVAGDLFVLLAEVLPEDRADVVAFGIRSGGDVTAVRTGGC